MKWLTVLLVVVMPMVVSAQIYSWTDESGTVHFTEDISSVPKKYQKKMIGRGDTNNSGKPEPAVTGKKQAATTSLPSPEVVPVPVDPKNAETLKVANNLYDGRSGADWQVEFRQKRAAVQAIDQQIKQLQTEMKSSKEMLTSEKVAALNGKRAELAKQYESAAAQLNQLVERAGRAGLPKEFSE